MDSRDCVLEQGRVQFTLYMSPPGVPATTVCWLRCKMEAGVKSRWTLCWSKSLSLIHISEPTRLALI
eukprot:8203516-Alexandrium_andersonii.AAC.1